MAGKYLNFGSMLHDDRYETDSLQLDNLQLKQLMDYIKAHGEKHLKGLSEEEIKAGERLKWDDPNHIPRIKVYLFEKKEEDYAKGCPKFIKAGIAVKKFD